MSVQENRAMYLAWLREAHPDLYSQVVEPAPLAPMALVSEMHLGGLLDSITSAFSNVVSSVSNALPNLAQTYATYEQQRNLLRLNTQRAQSGMAPLVYDAQGRLVTSGGIPYNENEWNIAGTGGIGTLGWVGIAAAAGLGAYLLARR